MYFHFWPRPSAVLETFFFQGMTIALPFAVSFLRSSWFLQDNDFHIIPSIFDYHFFSDNFYVIFQIMEKNWQKNSVTFLRGFWLKFMFSKKTTKTEEIFTVDLCSKCQIDCEDFVIFCGLFRKHELYWFLQNLEFP